LADISIDAVQPIGSITDKHNTGYSHSEQVVDGTEHIYTSILETKTGKVLGEKDTIVQIYDRFGALYTPTIAGGQFDSQI
jgi:hypothetical protein|tara:strand:- start:250 stop:489 length:240 start_codon:yes stop_codon:yes gene_type:complete